MLIAVLMEVAFLTVLTNAQYFPILYKQQPPKSLIIVTRLDILSHPSGTSKTSSTEGKT